MVPGIYASGWVVVLENPQGWPLEAFTFDISGDGLAATSLGPVGTCSPTGQLTLSFTGWQGDTVTGNVALQTSGTGTGTWSRAGGHPASGTARLTRQWDTAFAGNYQLVWDGDLTTATPITVSADGVVWMGGLGTGVIGNGGTVAIALRQSQGAGGGPIVLAGTLTAGGASGTYRTDTGGTGTWTANAP